MGVIKEVSRAHADNTFPEGQALIISVVLVFFLSTLMIAFFVT